MKVKKQLIVTKTLSENLPTSGWYLCDCKGGLPKNDGGLAKGTGGLAQGKRTL